MARRPPTLICYICGREFGSASLKIHQPQCMKKWEQENDALPKHLRRPKPQPMAYEGKSRDEINDMNFQKFTETLVPCGNCGRTFLPDRLVVHQRSCLKNTKGQGGLSQTAPIKPSSSCDDSSSPNRPASSPPKPRFLICNICGREFGSKSLGIHQPQCLAKWEIENSKLPKHLRRPAPQLLKGGTIEENNQQAWEGFKQQLVECSYCGRKFAPDRLSVHHRSCTHASVKGERPHTASLPTPLRLGPSPETPIPPPSHRGIQTDFSAEGGNSASRTSPGLPSILRSPRQSPSPRPSSVSGMRVVGFSPPATPPPTAQRDSNRPTLTSPSLKFVKFFDDVNEALTDLPREESFDDFVEGLVSKDNLDTETSALPTSARPLSSTHGAPTTPQDRPTSNLTRTASASRRMLPSPPSNKPVNNIFLPPSTEGRANSFNLNQVPDWGPPSSADKTIRPMNQVGSHQHTPTQSSRPLSRDSSLHAPRSLKQPPSALRVCPSCGAKSEEAKFCIFCGGKF